MGYTISTHNGHRVSREHNRRNRKITDKESHIRRDGHHETWIDIKPQDAYNELFGQAVSEYNLKQVETGHPERQIKDYYKKICDDKKKHPVYEMIVGIGNKDNHPPVWLGKTILKEFIDTWPERNPNLVLIGAYYHADEEGSGHVHCDYIPVAYNSTKGPSIQTALVRALTQQGIMPGETMKETAQILWEKQENSTLERICVEYGLDIEHPLLEHAKHMDMREFKYLKRISELKEENNKMIDRVNDLIDEYNQLISDNTKLLEENYELAQDIVDEYHVDRGLLIR
ncbi:MAG: plasmid recombination protein [Lachnospiraceae bacterium]|nr:plasmid recombination protein [Lachnospiraceae bacterium]